MSSISIKYLESISEKELRDSIFITGYQGFGMVGYITSRHIAEELELKRIGFIKTRYMPESTFYSEKRGLAYPFELYYGVIDDKKLIVLVNHATPHPRERTAYAEFVSEWLKKIGISKAILVGGLDPAIRESETEKYRWIPIGGFNEKLDAPLLIEKFVVGPLALTMMFMEAHKIPGVVILAYTELYRPDPRASAVAVETISKIIGIRISTEKLIREASIMEAFEREKERLMKGIEGEVQRERQRYSMHV